MGYFVSIDDGGKKLTEAGVVEDEVDVRRFGVGGKRTFQVVMPSQEVVAEQRYHCSQVMSLEQAILEAVHALPPEKQREILDYASRLRAETAKKPPFRSIEGLWAGLGVSLSADEIDETQREMWSGFPRNDI